MNTCNEIRFTNVCTCGGLYCSTEPMPMSFTLPHTRLVHDHLRPLSCQRLVPPATLTTWTSLLYVSLTDSLECQDAALLESLFQYIHIKHIPYTYSHTYMLISYQTYQFQFKISHNTGTTLYIILLRSKTTYNKRNQIMKHIHVPVSFKLKAFA